MAHTHNAQGYRKLFTHTATCALGALLLWTAMPTAATAQHREHKRMDVGRYMEYLDQNLLLTDEQEAKITELLQADKTQRDKQMEARREEREKAKEEREKIKEERRQQREQQQREHTAQREQLNSNIMSVLTPEQREKFEQIQQERRDKMEKAKEKTKNKKKKKNKGKDTW